MSTVQAGTELKEGVNYLYYRTADLLENQMTARSCLVSVICTSTYLFAIPIQKDKFDDVPPITGKFRFREGDDPTRGIERMLADENLTLEVLEDNLFGLLETFRPAKVFKIKELQGFKIQTGITGKTPLNIPGYPVQYLNVRGKGVKEIIKEFYSA